MDADTIPGKIDSLPRIDSLGRNLDSLGVQTDTFHLKLSKDSLDAPVEYKASDSMIMDVKTQRIILYSKASVKQKDMELTADSIELDQPSKLVVATYRRDTAGKIIGRPKMVQADSKMESDVIRYNFETQRGLTSSTITQQGEMIVQGEKIKKISPTEYFASRGQISTCNLDTPHFAFRTPRMKMVSQKLAVTGPIHPEFEGVPVPIYIPFGFFPLSQGRHSGLLPPQFTSSEQFGLGLEGLGYYKVLNDNFDVTLRSNIYSYGGMAFFVTPNYYKRYKYKGTLAFSYQNSRLLSNSAKEEFTRTKTFNINWSHSVDSRARPGTSFSANVNAGSTKYNQFVYNNPMANFSNQLNSSITYSKTWDTRFNLTASANHNQNNNTQLINLNLPNVAFTVNTFYPFQSKEFVGTPKWYQKLGIGLNSNVANQISVYERDFNLTKILDTMQWGVQNSIPIQLSLPSLGPIQIAPGISYSNRVFSRSMEKRYNTATKKVDTIVTRGLFTAHDVSFSVGVNTALFGMFNRFGPNSALRAIRHVVRPSVSLSYKPDLASGYYYDFRPDSAQQRIVRTSRYEGGMFGSFSEGVFGGISFGIDNNLEAKVRSKKDTANGGVKKIRLIDGFGFNSGYNLMADSFKLSNFNLYVRSTLFDKINITAGATMDPYQIDSTGYRVNKYAWAGGKGFSPGRITNGSIAISTSFQSKPKDEKKAKEQEEALGDLPPVTAEEQMAMLNYARSNPAEFADFNVPWSINLSFSFSFSRQFRADYQGFETVTSSNINLNGDFNLTPKWKIGASSYYDFKTSDIQSFTMSISREMHCWQMSINVTPVGLYRTFNITINPKSGVLRDLKINRTRYFYGQ
ncbi:MAG: putative LPS assembly protein LptD [Candidatus Pseudobacter hemicellulosilyticus]|uniref:LPS assembly protein LptD n=1 Tax=Candidatus Pseudobacter hemicellulosilyticus TaxID=3121375 RepID=A0AAJ5WS93_9BACT|nr:MAG: putative LPS assembly protein LptD [Pseudobacter sp.]